MSWPGWGIPVDIPAPANATDTPTSFNRLKFNQLGLYDLRRRIGVLQHARGVFTKYQAKFLASDIAWFAAGAHKDGNHCVPPGEFHSFFKAVREGTMTREERNNIRQQVIELLFDIATLSDRAFGGCTMVMHVDGTQVPNSPALPEYIKADVYIPPPFIEEHLIQPSAVASIVQHYIEDLAVPAVIRWKSAGRRTPGLNWRFNNVGLGDTPPPNNTDQPLIPPPIMPRSSHRVFCGRTSGSFSWEDTCFGQDDSSTLISPSSPPSSPISSSRADDDEARFLREEVEELKAVLSLADEEAEVSRGVIQSLHSEIKLLSTRLSAATSELGTLRNNTTVPSAPNFRGSSPLRTSTRSPLNSSQAATSARHPEPIKSFGPESAKAIDCHSLAHRVHTTLYRICDEFTIETWSAELGKLYPDRIVVDLVNAMHADIESVSSINEPYHICSVPIEGVPAVNPMYLICSMLCRHLPDVSQWTESLVYDTLCVLSRLMNYLLSTCSVPPISHTPFVPSLRTVDSPTAGCMCNMAPTLTIKSSSVRRARRRHKQAPYTAHQRALRAASRAERQANIDQAVGEWYSATLVKAGQLAATYNKKPRYFLDLFFQGGARMVQKRKKVNPWNAWISMQAEIANADTTIGEASHLTEVQQSTKAQYNALTPEEKAELAEEFRAHPEKVIRVNARSRTLDVLNVVNNMQSLLTGLNSRVGIQGFFCIVRSTANFHMDPQWYFTSSELRDYMKFAVRRQWDIGEVGAKIEAFAVAGCDPANLLTNSKQKSDYLKGQIRDRINAMLVEITGRPNVVMQYVNYERAIVLRLGVELQGWTHPMWANPSELSTSLPPLQILFDAIKDGSCKFVKLTREECKAREVEYQHKIKAGQVQVSMRKKRKDAGIKRRLNATAGGSNAERDEEEESSDGSSD